MNYDHPAGKLQIAQIEGDDWILKGTLMDSLKQCVVEIAAPAPAPRSMSFAGSGQAWPSAELAQSDSPNSGYKQVMDGTFSMTFKYPGAMYVNGGTTYVPPHIRVVVHDGENRIGGVVFLRDAVPFRRTTYHPERTGPQFYAGNKSLAIRDQWEMQEARAYPKTGQDLWKKEVVDFWGRGPRM